MRLVYAFLSLLSVVQAAQKGPLKFNVIGDWGVGNRFVAPDNKDFKPVHVEAGLTTAQFGHLLGRTEAAVTEAFQTVSDYFKPQFVISTGDQFYDDGLVSRNDPQFKTKFSDVFNHSSVNVTWYPTLGNHDYYMNPDNELNKASDDWRWYFPARNYSFSQYLEDGTEVLFVVMDVNPGLYKYRAEKELDPVKGKYKDKQIVQLLQAARSSWPDQLVWAEQLLNSTSAKWKIVVGHEPIYSSDGQNAFTELQQQLQPILERTNVSVYFSGHYHTLEITEVNGINYVISGAAAQVPYPIGNLTAAALVEYFQQHPLNMSMYPTTTSSPTTSPTYGPFIYPSDPTLPKPALPPIVHFKGGYEAWLPGFMTVEMTNTSMNILVWGMGNDTTWSVVKQHDILRKDLHKPNVVAGPLKFNVIGDWGVGNRFAPFDNKDFPDIHKKAKLSLQEFGQLLYLTEVAVSNQFQDVSDVFEPDFIISTGDQFYDDGLLTRDDPQFKTKFQDVYTRPSVNVPWYPVLGNHDYYMNPDAQINRTDDPRWMFPARNYSYSWFMEDGTEVLFLVMDVNPGLVKYRLEKDLNPMGGKYRDKKIVQLLQEAKATWPAQLEWADQTLGSSRATWKIVIGHEPIYSSTGLNSFTELQRDVQPILERHSVSVYFSGHFHTLEIVENNGIQYIISGAASQVPYPIGNLTSEALVDYFARHPVNMSEYPTTVPPTGSPPTAGPTIYPSETAPPQGKAAPITHFAGGYEQWLPGFMTCSVNLTHMHVEVWGLGNNTVWSIVKRHDVLRKDLRPANLVHKQLKFNVIGDWGVGKNFVAPDNKDFKPVHVQANLTTVEFGHLLARTEAAVTEEFQTVSDMFQPHFVLSTGDQFYDDGLVSRDDPQFKTKFSDVFNHSSVNVTWYPTLGNHDYYANPDNELNKYIDDWRWYFPARNYSFSWFIDDGTEVLFVVMDVNPALLKYRAEKEIQVGGKYVNKQIVQLLQAAKSSWPGQLAWAEQTLNATKAKWKIVMGHEPIYSSDGQNAFVELQLALQPILERTNVSVYFSGHYHTLEITEVNGINYVISGAAAQVPYPIGNLTAAALVEYFQLHPLNMSLYPTVATPTGPAPSPVNGTTIYPTDPKITTPIAKPQIIHFKGGYEAWLPGFMTCTLNATHLHIDTWGMNNDTVWSIWNRHDILRKDLQQPIPQPPPTSTPTPTATPTPTSAAATTKPPTATPTPTPSGTPTPGGSNSTTSPPGGNTTTPSNTTSSTGVGSSSSSSTGGVIPNGANTLTLTPAAAAAFLTFITMLFA